MKKIIFIFLFLFLNLSGCDRSNQDSTSNKDYSTEKEKENTDLDLEVVFAEATEGIEILATSTLVLSLLVLADFPRVERASRLANTSSLLGFLRIIFLVSF